ncbi:MAG: hypothetical protein OEV76_11645 [Anaerolineae bacterium]|nr:hypothetical protein [Anaerolineae bacterium]
MKVQPLKYVARKVLGDIRWFSKIVVGRELRKYQLGPAYAILDSVLYGKGLSFAIVFCRQAGKNEVSAQLEAYLLNLYQRKGGMIVKAAPTYKPQLVNSKLRLEEVLDNDWNRGKVRTREGYMTFLGRAGVVFLSADPASKVVGATASIMLECDEAQDVSEDKWEVGFTPMAASTNATRVFYGTVWTSKTMLAKIVRQLRKEQEADGRQRVFYVDWEQVAAEVPAYGEHVRKEIARKGRHHPMIKTQYFLEEIDSEGRMFDDRRQALMQGEHRRSVAPVPEAVYVATLDVAGEDEEMTGDELRAAKPRKDLTVGTMFEVDLSTLRDPLLAAPSYRVVDVFADVGTRHTLLYGKLRAYFEHWGVRWIVADASGVGAGLVSFLSSRQAFGARVVAFQFSPPKRKSDLGWDFLTVVETGRFKMFRDDGSADWREFWQQVEECRYEVSEGEEKRMKWGVVDARLHDDRVISAALVAELDKVKWSVPGRSVVIEARDVLEEIDGGRF